MRSSLKKVKLKRLEKAYQRMAEGSLIQSPRLLLFTHSNMTMEERGFYYADTVWGWGGSGIIIKFEEKFFILAPQHVIDKHVPDGLYQNESPFFSHVFAKGFNSSIEEFIFPIRGWKIGQLVSHDSPAIDNDDLVLIELGDLFLYPDRFIDLDSPHAPEGLPLRSLYKNMYLVASGFPAYKNNIKYNLEDNAPFVHEVGLSKSIYPGLCDFQDGFPIARLREKYSHEELVGMSGGIITNLQLKANKTEWVGMIQKAGNGILHFYPAVWIIPAIRRFRESESYLIDPAALLSDPSVLFSQEVIDWRREYYKTIRRLSGARKVSPVRAANFE